MLRITFINVGYGDSILVEELRGTKRVFAMLIDGGKPYDRIDRFEYDDHPGRSPVLRYLLRHGVGMLDVVMLTHFHIDHVGGLPEVLKALPYGEIWANCLFQEPFPGGNDSLPEKARPEAREMYRSLSLLAEIMTIARKDGRIIKPCEENEYGIGLGHGILADKYAVDPLLYRATDTILNDIASRSLEDLEAGLFSLDQTQNASCASLRLSYAGKSALFAADLPASHWNSILDAGQAIRADILKFPHHGQPDGGSRRFAEEVNPRHVVFCVSEDNPFACPQKASFSYFDPSVRFHATGSPDMPPWLEPCPAHSAIVFEISDESRLRWFQEEI